MRVAVVDSGIDAGHPALDGCVDTEHAVAFTVDPDGDLVEAPGPHDDSFGHGTACAGIIHSLAPAARITSIKVLGEGLAGKSAAFMAGLRWAVDHGFDVINLSLGTRKRDWALAFHDICDRAYFEGSFVVTAAKTSSATATHRSTRLSRASHATAPPIRIAFTSIRIHPPSSSRAVSTSRWRGSSTGA